MTLIRPARPSRASTWARTEKLANRELGTGNEEEAELVNRELGTGNGE